jgi:hypothetical protein
MKKLLAVSLIVLNSLNSFALDINYNSFVNDLNKHKFEKIESWQSKYENAALNKEIFEANKSNTKLDILFARNKEDVVKSFYINVYTKGSKNLSKVNLLFLLNDIKPYINKKYYDDIYNIIKSEDTVRYDTETYDDYHVGYNKLENYLVIRISDNRGSNSNS